MKAKLEYIWLDGYRPTQTMRSKTLIVANFNGKLDGSPIWSFDGSSTRQAAGNNSDCLLKPVALFPDPARKDGWFVMTEVLNADGTPHPSNGRATIDDDDNGSGMHANFSNGVMRSAGNKKTFEKICEEFGKHISEHIAVYGADNDKRLTGLHETQSIDKFSYGVSDRGASIRIPVSTVEGRWKGRLEDRRPASNADPYKVASIIIKTTKQALK